MKVLIKWSRELNSKVFCDCIRETGLMNRILNSVPRSGAERDVMRPFSTVASCR